MKTKILIDNSTYHIFKHDGIVDELPVGVYEFRFGPQGQVFLSRESDIQMPEKIYSNDAPFIKHVLTSFNNMDKGLLGVALVGGKGLGKSFTANQLAKDVNLPVIKLTGSVGNNSFANYLKQLDQDYVLFIDEFEKIFPTSFDAEDGRASQEELLSFLDGGSVRDTKVLFLITSNSDYKISDYFKNRPSRLRYYRNYEYLDEATIKEVIDDLLENKEHLNDLLDNIPYKDINLDALIKIINEVNLHNISYSEFRSFFNFKESVDMDMSAILIHPDKTEEPIGNVRSALYTGNRIGVSKQVINARNTPIMLAYTEPHILENSPSESVVNAFFYHPKEKDEDGDPIQVEVTVILRPNITSLSKHYVV